MTQYGAIQYCHWLFLKNWDFLSTPNWSRNGEYACKSWFQIPYTFWGMTPKSIKWLCMDWRNANESTQKVGTEKVPSPWGINMTIYGNVLEWKPMDQYDSDFYKRSVREKPSESCLKAVPRSVRGGSFASLATEIQLSLSDSWAAPDWESELIPKFKKPPPPPNFFWGLGGGFFFPPPPPPFGKKKKAPFLVWGSCDHWTLPHQKEN